MIDRAHIVRCLDAGKHRELAARMRAAGMRKDHNRAGWQDLNWKAGCALQDVLEWLDEALDEIDDLRKQLP